MAEPQPTERRKDKVATRAPLLYTFLGMGLAGAGLLMLFFALRAALAVDSPGADAAGWGVPLFMLAAGGGAGAVAGLALLRWPIHEFKPIARCDKCQGEIWHGDRYCSRCGEKVWSD
ncbi:MAG: hypothetical protein HY558_01120 [Euryarchaeota archaeon]|nr:hypothetical protein [Euryarchaeota archaeon]